MSVYEVTMLPVGESEIPGPELFWMSHWDEWLPLTFQVALVRGPGVVALVNTGPPRDLGPLNRGWETFLGARAALHRREGEFVLDQLASCGVAPSDVTHVVLTPLQLYSVSNVLAFEQAQICLAKRGWVHFHTAHRHPHDVRGTSVPPEILVRLVTDAWDRVRLLDDEDVIADGLRTWWAGAHHRASLVVEVATAVGTVAISDVFFWLENVIRDHPIGICENIQEALDAYERVRRNADVIVPLYDPANFDRFPDGRVR
jgi:hypothetical protein